MTKTSNVYSTISRLTDNNIRSKVRITHENLMSNGMAEDFNTYRMWSAVNMATDVDPLTLDDFKKVEENWQLKSPDERAFVKSTGIRAIFNKWHSVPVENSSFAWRVSQNMPLIDSPKTRQLQRSMNSCTVRDLVEKSAAGLLGASVYSYSDFMFCKYLGRVPNNYLITLRRYSVPVLDYIKPYGNATAINGGKESTSTDDGGAPIGTMVTWLGTPGNDMREIMKYTVSMPYKSVDSKFESDGVPAPNVVDQQSKGYAGKAFQTAFQSEVARRMGNHIMPGMFNTRENRLMSPPGPHYDEKRAYAGIDMIKSIYIRDADKGLQFKQSFKLTFDYELRSYDGVNGKQAMLDLLGNILSVCYTSGDFWPGAYRRESQASSYEPMSSLECMQHHKTFSEYVGAFSRDFQKIRGRVASMTKNPVEAITNLLNDLGGALLGGDLNMAPVQFKNGVNSLLSDTAVGLWHVTVGNPCAPMMSIGNLILTETQIEHYGPLGIDDFPTGLRVTCTFDSGKPRDKRLIERIYNGGNDRIYSPLDKTILETLGCAPDVHSMDKSSDNSTHITTDRTGQKNSRSTQDGTDASVSKAEQSDEAAKATREKLIPKNATSISGYSDKSLEASSVLKNRALKQRYFGTVSDYAVHVTAGEVADGYAAKTKDPNQGKQ